MDEERLIVSLEARIRDFEKNMARAERTGTRNYKNLRRQSGSATRAMERDMVRSTSRVNQALASTTSRIGAFGKAFAAGAIATGVAGLTSGIRRTVTGIADLGRQAERAGLSVQAFQELKFVSEQNRIDVDQLTDGIKELQLRADEFAVTGKGPAADAFQRLGLDAKSLSRALEDPQELFIDIIGKMEDLDKAAQIRVADEVFGGSAGERFVELLDLGESGMRSMIDRAHDLGSVLDDEAIAKATALDKRFAEIGQRVANLGKAIVVNIAGGLQEALTIDVDEIFGSAERAVAMMGEEAYQSMKVATEVTDDQRTAVVDLQETYEGLFRSINSATGPDGIRLMDVADLDVAHDLAAILQDLEAEMQAFQTGAASADEFETEISELVAEAEDLLAGLNDVDAARFGGVITAIGGISDALATAIKNAATLRNSLPGRELVYSGRGGDPRLFDNGRDGTTFSPEGSTRPNLPSVNASFGTSDPERTSRSGGGGGRTERTPFADEMAKTRESIALLEAEAVAYTAVASSGRGYGDAVEYARKRAELLIAAQQQGKPITAELRAEVDELAKAFVVAGVDAETAKERIKDIEEQSERAADRMTDIFLGLADGSLKAKDAVKGLLLELVKVQAQKAFTSLFSGAGARGIASLFGFSEGGYTGAGGKYEPAGIVHKGEFVMNAEATRKPGALALFSALNSGARGFSDGGLVGPVSIPQPRPMTGASVGGSARGGADQRGTHVTFGVDVDDSGNLRPYITSVTERAIRQAAPGIASQAQQQTLQYMSETTEGWG